jgi:hypothetical protein
VPSELLSQALASWSLVLEIQVGDWWTKGLRAVRSVYTHFDDRTPSPHMTYLHI